MIKKYVRDYTLFKESIQNDTYASLITDLCVAMLLINPNFLDNILDLGLKARYTGNSSVFLNDLKTLLVSKNRLKLGKFVGETCVEDTDVAKVYKYFQNSTFSIENEWKDLVNSRIIARNIVDKILMGDKLEPDMIKNVYWTALNKQDDYNCDLVIELTNDTQLCINLNRKINLSKSMSFNSFIDKLFSSKSDLLYSDSFIQSWDKLAQEWVNIIYLNANDEIKSYIEGFIDPDRIFSIQWREYFRIKHTDEQYKHLGIFVEPLGKNVVYLHELLSDVYKGKTKFIDNFVEIQTKWNEIQKDIIDSTIIEKMFIDSFKENKEDIVDSQTEGFYVAGGNLKNRLLKFIVELLGLSEMACYYFANNGNIIYTIPSKEIIRQNIEKFNIEFSFHVPLDTDDDSFDNLKLILSVEDKEILNLSVKSKWSGGEMSGKLSSSIKFDIKDEFNYVISNL